MEIVLEKSQVVDLRLDLHKQGISIGDDLNLVVNDQDQFILYFEPKRTIWSRFFYKLVPKVFGQLHPNDAEHLTKYLQNASKIRVKVVDTVPKHLSADNTDVACEPPHLNWSSAMFRKRRTDNDEQTTEAGRDYHEVEAS